MSAGNLYPTAIRSTGMGWGLASGRLGGVFGPHLGAALIGQGWGGGALCLFAAAPAPLAAMAIATFGVQQSGEAGRSPILAGDKA